MALPEPTCFYVGCITGNGLKAGVNKHITVYDMSKEKHTSGKICSNAFFHPKAANAIYSQWI